MKHILLTLILGFSLVTSAVCLMSLIEQENSQLFKFSDEQQKQICNNVNNNGAVK